MNLPVEICLTTCLSASAYFKKGSVVLLLNPSPPHLTFDFFLLPDPENKRRELYICQVVVTVESGPTAAVFIFLSLRAMGEGGGSLEKQRNLGK